LDLEHKLKIVLEKIEVAKKKYKATILKQPLHDPKNLFIIK